MSIEQRAQGDGGGQRATGLRSLVRRLLLLPCCLLLVVCGKVADPQPPLVLIPQPTRELSGMQLGDNVVLIWPAPKWNTNGSPVTTLKRIDIYRLTELRNDNPPPMSEEEYAKRAQLIKSMKAEEMGNFMRNGVLTFRDELAFDDRSQIFRRSFRYAVKFVNNKNKNAGFSNLLYISPIPIPAPPKNVRAVGYTKSAIELRWDVPERNLDGSRPPKVVGYNVFRGGAENQIPDRPLNEKPITENFFKDANFEFGKTYYYAVSVVASTENPYAEGLRSTPVSVRPLDTFAPEPPAGVTTLSEPGEIRLLWVSSPDPDVVGYNVYRSETSGRDHVKLNAAPVSIPFYKDSAVQAGKQYFYVIKAISKAGNESAASQEVSDVAK